MRPSPKGKSRAAIFKQRQQRYLKRAKRRHGSWPTYSPGNKGDANGWHHTSGPYVFAGDGSQQQPLHKLLKKPRSGANAVDPYYAFDVTPAHYRVPPSVHFKIHHDEWNTSHQKYNIINFFNRTQAYRGHKLDRMNGFQRKCWFAVVWANTYRLYISGISEWPSWDPLHRTPVNDTSPY